MIVVSLPTNIVDFRGFDSSTILIYRGGILMSMGDLPESLSRAMLAGILLVGGLAVCIYIYIYIYTPTYVSRGIGRTPACSLAWLLLGIRLEGTKGVRPILLLALHPTNIA